MTFTQGGERGEHSFPSTPATARSLGGRFAYLWGTFAISSLGDGFGYGAVPLLALFVDPHPLPVASVAAADTFPWLVLALPAGALADHFERGRLMALTNLGRALVLVILAMLVASHHITLPLLVALVFVNGGARAIYYSASQATVPELVEPHSFPHANGILSGTEAATEHLGGPILGALTFAVTKALPFFADASAVGIAGLSLLGFRTQRPESTPEHGSILDGVRQLVKDRSLRLLVSLLAALAGLQGLVMGVLVIIATVDWGVSKSLYGVFLAAGAAGNVPGALLAGRIADRIGNIPTLIGSAVISGLAYLVMASAKGWLLAGIGLRRRQLCRLCRERYRELPAPEPLPERPDGTRRLSVARRRVGRVPDRVSHRGWPGRARRPAPAARDRRRRPMPRGDRPRPSPLRADLPRRNSRWARPRVGRA